MHLRNRTLALLLAAFLSLGVAACNGEDATVDEDTTTDDTGVDDTDTDDAGAEDPTDPS